MIEMAESQGSQKLTGQVTGSLSGGVLSNSQNMNTFPETSIDEFHYSPTN